MLKNTIGSGKIEAAICIVFVAILAHAAPPPGYRLAWSDEFNGTKLNRAKWEYARNGWRSSAYNTPRAVSVTNGCLVITTYTSGGTNFTGFIDTKNRFESRYGYYEASIEFSNAPGQWSAFWIQSPWMMNVQPYGGLGNINDNPTNGVEIDVFEHRCVDARGHNWIDGGDHALHWNGYGFGEHHAVWSSRNLGVGNGFHTYGFLWTTNSYTFYVDDKVTWTTKSYTISSAPEFIRLTSEVETNSWAGTVPPGGYPGKADSQIKMYVDYVRYYAPGRDGGGRRAATGAIGGFVVPVHGSQIIEISPEPSPHPDPLPSHRMGAEREQHAGVVGHFGGDRASLVWEDSHKANGDE